MFKNREKCYSSNCNPVGAHAGYRRVVLTLPVVDIRYCISTVCTSVLLFVYRHFPQAALFFNAARETLATSTCGSRKEKLWKLNRSACMYLMTVCLLSYQVLILLWILWRSAMENSIGLFLKKEDPIGSFYQVRSVPGSQQPLVLACVDVEGKLRGSSCPCFCPKPARGKYGYWNRLKVGAYSAAGGETIEKLALSLAFSPRWIHGAFCKLPGTVTFTCLPTFLTSSGITFNSIL